MIIKLRGWFSGLFSKEKQEHSQNILFGPKLGDLCKRFTPFIHLRAFLQPRMPLHCLCSTPLSALPWYHSPWSSLLAPLDWPSHFRPVRIAQSLPIPHHRLSITVCTLNEKSSPQFTVVTLRESPFELSYFVCVGLQALCSDMCAL